MLVTGVACLECGLPKRQQKREGEWEIDYANKKYLKSSQHLSLLYFTWLTGAAAAVAVAAQIERLQIARRGCWLLYMPCRGHGRGRWHGRHICQRQIAGPIGAINQFPIDVICVLERRRERSQQAEERDGCQNNTKAVLSAVAVATTERATPRPGPGHT